MDLTELLFVLVVLQGYLKPHDLKALRCPVPFVLSILVVEELIHLDDFFLAVLRFRFQ